MQRAVWYRQGWTRLRLADVLLIAVYAWFVRINLPHAWRGDVAVLLLVVQEACIICPSLTTGQENIEQEWPIRYISALNLAEAGGADVLSKNLDRNSLLWVVKVVAIVLRVLDRLTEGSGELFTALGGNIERVG